MNRMLASMLHRGPDGEGLYADKHVLLGMSRLSIIDLNGGWQPLYNEDRSLVLVANGEIYNYVELTTLLKGKGHSFSSASDVETILHLYEEYGDDCVHHLRGMFAFALYDTRNAKVLLARDRMGEKPLYYHVRDDRILFASEMKTLLASGVIPFELDPVAVDQFFHYQYVPEPRTPLKDVRKLEPGHVLTIDITRWRTTVSCYWRLEDAAAVAGDPVKLIRAELDTISELIIRSDVPVGLALSGGLDSSAIAALAVRKYRGVMHAFSVGYTGRPESDERADAKALADYLKIPIHEIELKTADLVDVFDEMNFMRDDPIADISGYGYFAISKAAREQGVPVLLQGQGGDELFWGYPWVRDAVLKTEALLAGPDQKDAKAAFWQRLKFWQRDAVPSGQKSWRPFFIDLAPDFQHALSYARALYTRPFTDQLGDASPYDLFTYPSRWDFTDIRLTRLICETYLLQNGIAQGDRLSMANSVELRLPFVDYRLVELVIGLRKTHREHPDFLDFPKPWLRGAVKDILPEWVINRPKRGFAPPVQEWHTALFSTYGSALENGQLVSHGVITGQAGKALAAGPFPNGTVSPLSFKALVLELWCRKMQNACNGLNGAGL